MSIFEGNIRGTFYAYGIPIQGVIVTYIYSDSRRNG